MFDLIARPGGANLCEVPIAVVAMFDGTMVHLVTQSGFDDRSTLTTLRNRSHEHPARI